LSPGRRDLVVILLAVAGVVGAISLAGIFVVYLVDTIGNDDGGTSTAQKLGVSGTSGVRGPSAPTGGTGSLNPPAKTPTGTSPSGNPGALNLIPKNQEYVTFTNRSAGYSMLYPKGWTRQGSGSAIEFVHNNDYLNININRAGGLPSVSAVRDAMRQRPGIRLAKGSGNPGRTTINGEPAIHATLIQKEILQRTPQGAIRLVIDAYRLAKKGKLAGIDLASPDRVRPRNLDDYDKMVKSFRWL
jgi:hypothetical protein